MWLQAGLRGRDAVGVLGAVMVTVGAFLYAVMPRTGYVAWLLGLRSLRASPHAEFWGLLLCFAGLALLTAAWLLLGMGLRMGVAGRAAVTRAVWLWSMPLLIAPPVFSGDGWSYAADAFITGHGASPYVVTPVVLHGPIVEAVCTCWRTTPAPYGPAALLWGGALGHFSSSPWLLMLWYRVLALIGVVLFLWAIPRLARLSGINPTVATWLVVASPFMLTVGIGGSHLDLVMAGIVAAALAITASRGWLLGAVLIGVATAIKAPAAVGAIGVVLLSLRSGGLRQRVVRSVQVAAVAGAVLTAIGVAGGLGWGWIRAMQAALVLHTPLSLTYDVRRGLALLGLHHAKSIVDTGGIVVLVLALVLLLWRAPVRRPAASVLTVALAMALVTLLSPVTNYWYYLWCLPLLAACRLPRTVRCAVLGFVAALGMIGPLDPALRLPHANLAALMVVVAGAIVGAAATPFVDRLPTQIIRAAEPGTAIAAR